MADSPKTEIPSSGEDFYHFSMTLMQNWHPSLTLRSDESDESVVQYSLMWGMPDMQRMQSD